MTTSSPAGLGTQYQKLIIKKALRYAVQETVMDQFVQESTFPQNIGSKQVRWLRPDAPSATNVGALTEGVPFTTLDDWGYTAVDVTLKQYGNLSTISDVLKMTDLLSTLRQTVKRLGQNAALHSDFLIMTELLDTTNTGTSTISTSNNRYAQGITSYNNLVAATAANGSIVIQDFLGAVTRLKITRAPKRNGGYVAVVPPQVSFDVMNDSKFTNAGVYGSSQGLFKGEIGKWYGVRFVETTVPWIEANSNGAIGAYSGGGSIYTSLVLGDECVGATIMGGQSEFNPKLVILDKPDKSDKLNQYVSVGWKSLWAAATLNNTWAVALRSKTNYA